MSEWRKVPLGSLALKLVNGGTPSTTVSRFWNGDIPWITGADFTSSGITEFRRFVSRDAITYSSTNLIHRGQLLIVTRTGVGKLALAPCDIAISQDITGFYTDETQALPEFLFHRLQSGVNDLKKLNQGTSINGIIRDDLTSYVINLPPINQQRRIAEILSTVDEAIEQTEALIEKYRKIKAGMMQDLFTRGVTPDGKLRPPRSQAPDLYKPSELGWIPNEWEAFPLARILRECGGYLQTGPFGSQLHAHEYQRDGVPVVMPQDINDGKISIQNIAMISSARATTLYRHQARMGDVIIARRGDLSRAAAISLAQEGWICGTGCFLLRLNKSQFDAKFAAKAYSHGYIQRQIAGISVGTTMPSLNNKVMESLYFPFCKSIEQLLIVELIEANQHLIDSETMILDKLALEKQGLMQDLLTGKVPVC